MYNMNIAFRVDASNQIGTGHVMRCLTLADELQKAGGRSLFLCKVLQGDLIHFIEARGYDVVRLQIEESNSPSWDDDACQCVNALIFAGGVDWLVVDCYSLDIGWETLLRTVAKKIFVIDDLADRPHNCDVLLDQNYYVDSVTRYEGLIPAASSQLLGPLFSLLRPQFMEARSGIRKRDGHIRRILVFFGGSDLQNESLRVLQAMRNLTYPEVCVDLIIGMQNPHRYELKTFAASLKWITIHYQVSNMAELIAAADLYVGAAGTTTWERCCLGLPSLVITVAANQIPSTMDLHQLGVLTYLGASGMVTFNQLSMAIENCVVSPEKMKAQSDSGFALVDGLGTSRCAQVIIKKK